MQAERQREVGSLPLVTNTTFPVDFRGNRLLGVLTKQGAFLPLRPLVLSMGLEWTDHLQRVQHDPILAKAATDVEAADGSKDFCLPLVEVYAFVIGINPAEVPRAARRKVLNHQLSCFDALSGALAYLSKLELSRGKVSGVHSHG